MKYTLFILTFLICSTVYSQRGFKHKRLRASEHKISAKNDSISRVNKLKAEKDILKLKNHSVFIEAKENGIKAFNENKYAQCIKL